MGATEIKASHNGSRPSPQPPPLSPAKVAPARALPTGEVACPCWECKGLLFHKDVVLLRCLAAGYTQQTTASYMNISYQTTKNRITSLLKKLGVVNSTQAVAVAIEGGLI